MNALGLRTIKEVTVRDFSRISRGELVRRTFAHVGASQ